MTTMESEIERIFQNAQAWKAILLLDEAEAIMMERSPDKMEQNSWVSGMCS
jgi:SpoVK/Ycf46/Vps4 family AAA+-type ATPase